MISLSAAVTIMVYLIVASLVFWLFWWLLGYIGLPEPFNKIAHVILVLLAVLVLIGMLVNLGGGQALFRS